MPAKYVRPYSKGQKNDFRDAEAIAEAVQRPTMKFVATKTTDQLDLQALHRMRERLVSQRTGIQPDAPRRMLSLDAVLDIVPVKRTTLFRMERDGRFPPSTLISPNRRAWFEDEISAWQKALPQARRAPSRRK